MNESKQQIIQKYVILKIMSEEWKPNDKIYSENKMSKQFGFSRFTVRMALQPLVDNGLLDSKQGDGYFVAAHRGRASFRAIHGEITKQKLEIIKDSKKIEALQSILGFEKEDNIIALKKSFYSEKKLWMIQYSFLNKNLIWKIDEKAMEKSLTNFLAFQGIAIKYADTELVGFKDEWKIFDKERRFFNIENYLVEFIFSYSQDGWVERTIRFKNPKDMEIKFRQFNFL